MYRKHKRLELGGCLACDRSADQLPFRSAKILSHVGVTYKTGFWIGWLDLSDLIHSYTSWLQALQRYRYSTHFAVHRSTPLGFSVFTSRILATDLSRSHCNLKSHIPFFPRLIIFFFIILQLPTQFCTKFRSRPAGFSKIDSILDSTNPVLSCRTLLLTTLHGPRRTEPVLLTRRVYRVVA
jgi:hypothetical protein